MTCIVFLPGDRTRTASSDLSSLGAQAGLRAPMGAPWPVSVPVPRVSSRRWAACASFPFMITSDGTRVPAFLRSFLNRGPLCPLSVKNNSLGPRCAFTVDTMAPLWVGTGFSNDFRRLGLFQDVGSSPSRKRAPRGCSELEDTSRPWLCGRPAPASPLSPLAPLQPQRLSKNKTGRETPEPAN